MSSSDRHDDARMTGIAIIGMTGRFPGATDLDAYWRNLRDGVESITFFSESQLRAEGVPADLLAEPAYVRARGILDEVEMFDAAFFGYSPIDALMMDPQQRLFLQGAWEALEAAGYDPRTYAGLIGVYGGATASSYGAQLYQALPPAQLDGLALALGNELAFLTTRVSYKLDLKGPSYPVQTACSTSLVAVHLACQGLLNAECDMAIAGGVSVRVPQTSGYRYQQDGIFSPDGRCRPFDARSQGTLFGNGIGLIVLKRLDDALADGDSILAVIKGSAVNNDGVKRASFTAPGVNGQTNVIADALASAEIDPETVSYVEAHGTATALGDSIEIQALTKAFATEKRQFCAIGSVKANVGHLDAAAGIAGLIKTVLALRHGQLPPLLHFESPNPDIKFESTPFYVNATLKEWQTNGSGPRRAGVSSFGFGGTNAHVVIEEAPEVRPSGPSRPWQILPISADSENGLEVATANLAEAFRRNPSLSLADAAYTLKVGRRGFKNRRVAICSSRDEAIRVLDDRDPLAVFSGVHDGPDRSIVFLFPGQGSQFAGMGRDLYQHEPVYRRAVDESVDLLRPHLGFDLRDVLHAPDESFEDATRRLTQTSIAQAALFVVEHALARLWMSWGVTPEACLGHSVGEYVAAHLSGVLTLEDAIGLVAVRGRLMQEMPAGAMLAVPLSESRVRRLLKGDLWLAAVNAPSLCVVSGTSDAVAALEQRLHEDGVQTQRLQTSHAFHSGLIEGAVEPLVSAARHVAVGRVRIPYISNLTGRWIDQEQLADPAYWGRQMRETVRFSAGVAQALETPGRLFLEVGPGRSLSTLVSRHVGPRGAAAVLSSLRHPQEQDSDTRTVMTALGRVWLSGANVDWTAFYEEEDRRRVSLPTYPFNKQRYFVGPRRSLQATSAKTQPAGKVARVEDWFYKPIWTEAPLSLSLSPLEPSPKVGAWLVFQDQVGVANQIIDRLERDGHTVFTVTPGEGFANRGDGHFTVDSSSRRDYERLIGEACSGSVALAGVLHLWGVTPGGNPFDALDYEIDQEQVFGSVLLLAQALGHAAIAAPVRINVITTGVHEVTGVEALSPGKAMVLGLRHVIAQEYPHLACKVIDLDDFRMDGPLRGRTTVLDQVLHDAMVDSTPIVAYRGTRRWTQSFQSVQLSEPPAVPARLRVEGVYLITGGLGDIALSIAEYLARTVRARLVLTSRSALPAEAEWDRRLALGQPNDLVARRIERIRRIRSLGGEVLVLRADVGDRTAMSEAFDEAEQRFGRVDGVIHAAGLIEGEVFRPISETTRDVWRQQFHAKVVGLAVIDEIVCDRDLDFCMLFSSLSSVLGGLNFGCYASANAFLDAVARRRNRTSAFPWLTVNWDSWLRTDEQSRLKAAGLAPRGYVMTAEEGIRAFHRLMAADVGAQIAVSTGDLQTRLDQWVALTPIAARRGDRAQDDDLLRLPRPNLRTAYVAPSGDLEGTITEVFRQVLGIEQVGIHDNFFEMGGHSLKALEVASLLHARLGAEVRVTMFYEAPTAAMLAGIIQPRQISNGRDDAGRRAEGRLQRLQQRRRATATVVAAES